MRTTAVLIVVLGACSAATAAAADEKKTCADAYVAAQTLRDQHQLLAARDRLRTCARRECSPNMRGQMVKDCSDWLAQVEAAIPSLVFEVKDGAGNDLSAVRVSIDGQPLAEKVDGTAIPVDPGEHRFLFETEGVGTTEKSLVVREGDKERHVRVVLGAAAATSDHAAAPATNDGSTQRTVGLAVGAAGVVGLSIGAVLGIMAKGAWDGSHDQCPGGCQALTEANTATGALIAGGILLAGGALLYFTAPRVGVGLGPSSGGAVARLWGTW